MTEEQQSASAETETPCGLYVYVLPPAGHWHGWRDLSKTQPQDIFPTSSVESTLENLSNNPFRAEVDRLLFNGRKLAEKTLGYEGDVAFGPYLSMLPASPDNIPLVAWVQASRGLGFVASPVPLPYLEDYKSAADAVLPLERKPWVLA